jgi:hypothetical protein
MPRILCDGEKRPVQTVFSERRSRSVHVRERAGARIAGIPQPRRPDPVHVPFTRTRVAFTPWREQLCIATNRNEE